MALGVTGGRPRRAVLVAGGAGGVGEGIVRALLASGDDLTAIVTSRDADRLERLKRALPVLDVGRMATIVANAGSVEGARAVARRTAEDFGCLDAAIPSLGGWWQGGPFLSVDAATRDAVMAEMLGTHFAFAQTFIPELLRHPGGRYIGIGGSAALEPIRNASLVSIAAAAQMMMTRALALELAGAAVDIMELVVDGPIRTRASEAFARPWWISADDVGRVVSDLVRNQTPTWPNLRADGPIVIMEPRSPTPSTS